MASSLIGDRSCGARFLRQKESPKLPYPTIWKDVFWLRGPFAYICSSKTRSFLASFTFQLLTYPFAIETFTSTTMTSNNASAPVSPSSTLVADHTLNVHTKGYNRDRGDQLGEIPYSFLVPDQRVLQQQSNVTDLPDNAEKFWKLTHGVNTTICNDYPGYSSMEDGKMAATDWTIAEMVNDGLIVYTDGTSPLIFGAIQTEELEKW